MTKLLLRDERARARDTIDAAFSATLFAGSTGMIWDLATGHLDVFDRRLTNCAAEAAEPPSSGSVRL